MRLSDAIEQFIKTMLTQEAPEVELKRNELAEYFNCAPSQINYVLGHPLHARPRLHHRKPTGGRADTSASSAWRRIPASICCTCFISGWVIPSTRWRLRHLVQQLQEREVVTKGEAAMMNAALSPQALSLPLSAEMKDALRARILKNMLLEVARKGKDQ